MRRNIYSIVFGVVVAIATSVPCLGADPSGVTDADALTTLRRFDRTLQAARDRVISDLRITEAKLVRAGDTDEAAKIREVIAQFVVGTSPTTGVSTTDALFSGKRPTALADTDGGDANTAKALINTRWKKGGDPDASNWVVTFHDDMSVTSTHHEYQGTWSPVTGGLVRLSISMNSCSSELLKIDPTGTKMVDAHGQPDFVRLGQ